MIFRPIQNLFLLVTMFRPQRSSEEEVNEDKLVTRLNLMSNLLGEICWFDLCSSCVETCMCVLSTCEGQWMALLF